MKTKYTLEFTPMGRTKKSANSARSQPLSICKNNSTLAEDIVAKIIVPGHIGHGLFTKASSTDGKGLNATDIRSAVKMTVSPEMWDLLMALDREIDSIRTAASTWDSVFGPVRFSQLFKLHNQIKELIPTANKIGHKVRSSDDDGITRFEM